MNSEFLHINWQDFHFLRPQLLWLLVPAFLSLLFALLRGQEQIKWQQYIAVPLRKYVISKGSENKIKRIQILTIVVSTLAILGLAGPTWQKIQVPGKILETPVVIALDMSQSMMATDIQPDRLERAKFKIRDFLEANPHARTALIGFAGTAHTIVPLTDDYKIIYSFLNGIEQDIMPVPGTNIPATLQLCDTITSVTIAPGRLILFTDDFTEETFKELRRFVTEGNTTVEIVPVNTINGAKIPKPDSKSVFKNKNGEAIISALNDDILQKLDAVEGIGINRLTLDNSDMELLAKKIGSNIKFQEEEEIKEDEWIDRGLLFAIPFALLVLFWFRKGWVIFSFLLMMGLTSCQNNSRFKDLWLTKDYQAQQAFDKANYTEAAHLFQDPMRQGVAWYRAGNYEKAIEAFEQDTSAQGAYNLGLAYYKAGNYLEAEQAFAKAVELNPGMGDAAKNREMMEQLAGIDQSTPEKAEEVSDKPPEENIQNTGPEDLGGGGQEATEKDMEKERKEETAETGKRKGKELEDVPDDFESGEVKGIENVVMQRVDDNPALFLKRKFRYQLKKGMVAKPSKDVGKW